MYETGQRPGQTGGGGSLQLLCTTIYTHTHTHTHTQSHTHTHTHIHIHMYIGALKFPSHFFPICEQSSSLLRSQGQHLCVGTFLGKWHYDPLILLPLSMPSPPPSFLQQWAWAVWYPLYTILRKHRGLTSIISFPFSFAGMATVEHSFRSYTRTNYTNMHGLHQARLLSWKTMAATSYRRRSIRKISRGFLPTEKKLQRWNNLLTS